MSMILLVLAYYISERTSIGISLEVFADADYASKATDRRYGVRRSNYVWRCICVLVFQDAKVTLSHTSEAECVALGDAVK